MWGLFVSPRYQKSIDSTEKALCPRSREAVSHLETCLEFTISRRARSQIASCGGSKPPGRQISFNWLLALQWSPILVLLYLLVYVSWLRKFHVTERTQRIPSVRSHVESFKLLLYFIRYLGADKSIRRCSHHYRVPEMRCFKNPRVSQTKINYSSFRKSALGALLNFYNYMKI